MSSSNLSTLSSGPGTPAALRAAAALSDSSPAIDRLCERVEREVWGGGGGGSAGRLMRRQKSELDAGVVLRRQLHYASQKRLNRHSSELERGRREAGGGRGGKWWEEREDGRGDDGWGG